MTHAQDFIDLITERGHKPAGNDIAGLKAELKKGPVTGYIGFDPTAKSMHVGNFAQIMLLRRLQQTGNRPIALVGGATGRISDPSERNDMRPTLSDEAIRANVARFKTSLSRFIDFNESKTGGILVDNYDWLGGISYLEMLGKIGTYFTINRMLTMDSVKSRLEREVPMTFLEFNYMIMQGYDFVILKEKYGCTLQMGGSDQWGNILQGVDLGHRMKGYNLFAIHQPLLTTASGQKMGKSSGNAVWIDADQRSPYEFWQYWRNAEDGDVGRWLGLFTELPMDEVKRLAALGGSEINEAKKILANEVTTLVHGKTEAENAAKTAQATFEQGTMGADLPTYKLAPTDLTITDLVVSAGLAPSKGEARKLIQGGGIRLNDVKVADVKQPVTSDLFTNNELKLSKGQKHIVKVTAA